MDELLEQVAEQAGPRGQELASRADRMEETDLSRALAAWDYIELAAIFEYEREGYLNRAEAILDGGSYSS